jgi:UDP-GlcNAc:undecaprenyl-phosphate GlcNAc-1-phosphate transferase
VDNPDKSRKLHEKPIPMVGGIAVFCTVATLVAAVFTMVCFEVPLLSKLDGKLATFLGYPADYLALRRIRSTVLHQYSGLLIGSAILLFVGVMDDRFGVRGRQKLFGQFLATTVLVIYGYRFDSLAFMGLDVDLDVFSILFIYGWVLASINSVNLLDGADGIAATIGMIMGFALAIMLMAQGRVVDAIVAVSLAGALLGFLRYNFPPASVYLGDAGSMLIGFLLAALAIRCTVKQNSLYAFAAPIALLAIPFIDTGAAIIRRRLTGKSIFAVDRGHLHHKLMKRGFGPKTSLAWVALLSAMSAAGGVIALVLRQAEYALLAVICVIVVMIVNQIFGIAETELILKRAYGFSRSLIRNPRSNSLNEPLTTAVHVQGDLDWKTGWEELSKYAEKNQLHQLTFDINAPWLHEAFHAKLNSREKVREANHLWKSVLPLISDGRIFGSLTFKCSQDNPKCHREIIAELMEIGTRLESLIRESSSGPIPSVNNEIPHGESDKVSTLSN